MPPEASARVALTVSLGLVLAGCASQPRVTTRYSAESGRNFLRSAQGTQYPATIDAFANPHNETRKETQKADITTQHNDAAVVSAGHPASAAEADLWSVIRSGFVLDGDTQHRRVREWTQAYATHSASLERSLDRARPFLWHVVRQVNKRGMPTEIALLPIVESGYDPSARSYMGASGLWQFMPGTADHMGLPRDWWYDARNDVIASTNAALDYLTQLNKRYRGDWLLALAAYNAGPGTVDAALARARADERGDSYWDLTLPLETTEYIPKLLAVRRIIKTPSRFGMNWPSLDNAPHTRAVALPGQTELAVAARMLDMPEDRLRRLNPGMRRWASAPDDDLALLVPAAKADSFRDKLASVDPDMLVTLSTHTVRHGDVLGLIAQHYRVSVAALRQANHISGDRIRVGETLQIPHPGAAGEVAPPSDPTRTYIVQVGDTLWNIAHRYRIDVSALRASNTRVANALHPGQTLIIPGSATPPEPSIYVVQDGDTLWSIAKSNDVTAVRLRRWNRLRADTALQPGRAIAVDGPAPLPDYYEVESGDSLWSIARRFSMPVATLRSLNELSTNSTIRPGQRLRLQPAISG